MVVAPKADLFFYGFLISEVAIFYGFLISEVATLVAHSNRSQNFKRYMEILFGLISLFVFLKI